MKKLHIIKLIRIFLFGVCAVEMLGESAYGMDTQFNPVVIPEYKDGKPSEYPMIVAAALAALPKGHPCKDITSTEKTPNKLRTDILRKCDAILSETNATAAELQRKLQAEEALRRQREAALAEEQRLHAQMQQRLAEEQRNAALLKQQQEAQAALLKQQQEEQQRAALLKQQQEAATQAALIKQQQEEQQRAALLKQHEAERAKQAALLEQQAQQHQAELQKARQQIELLQSQQPQRINEQIQQLGSQTEIAISSLIGLVFNIDDKKKRPLITKNSAFLKEYSDFLLVHTANVEQDEQIPQLKSFLKIPNRRQDTQVDLDNLDRLNEAIDKGIAAVNTINDQLQALTDTLSGSYRDISAAVVDVTGRIQGDWSVVKKFNYLKEKLTPLASYMGNLLGTPLLMNQNDDQIKRLAIQFKNKAFNAILANSEQYINFFQLWTLIPKEDIVRKIDFQFHENVAKEVAIILKDNNLVQDLNDKMKEALANSVKWPKSFEEIKKTQETNEICDFFSDLEKNIVFQYTTYHQNMTKMQEQSKKAGSEFIAARVGARDRELKESNPALDPIKIVKAKINNMTNLTAITTSLKNAQGDVLKAIDNWVTTSLTSPDNQSDIDKVEKALEGVVVKGSEEFNTVLKNLKDIVESAIEGFIKNQRLDKLSENILTLNEAHHDLLRQIAALPKLTSDYKVEDKEQTFLSVNIRLLKESFSENLTAGTFNNYLDLEPAERANLYSHIVKMLGIDFPKAPTPKLNLAADIFPEIPLDSEKEKYKAQFKKLYDKYIFIQKSILNLNLGGEEVSVPGDKVEFVDLAAPINIPNLLPSGLLGGQGGPPPPPPPPGGSPPPPPPGGMGNMAMRPGEADEIAKIKAFQVSLFPIIEKIAAWEGTISPDIASEKVYKETLKQYYTNLYNAIRDFYAKIGNPYPAPADQIEKFSFVAQKIFEETLTHYNKKSSVKNIKALSSYYKDLLVTAINDDQHPLPSLKTEGDVDMLIVDFLAVHPDQKPAQKPQNLNPGQDPGQNPNPRRNLKSLVKVAVIPPVTITNLGADVVGRIKNGEKINFDALAKPEDISNQQWDDEKSKLIIYQFELRDLPRFSLKAKIEASGWTDVNRENTLKIAYDLFNTKTSLATLQHVNALPDGELATDLMYEVMIQIITEKMKLIQRLTPEIGDYMQAIWQNKPGLTDMLRLASDIREKKPLADLQQQWSQIKDKFNATPEKELAYNLTAYLALSDLVQGMGMVKTQIWNNGEGYLNYLLEQVNVEDVPDVKIKDKLKDKWALLRS